MGTAFAQPPMLSFLSDASVSVTQLVCWSFICQTRSWAPQAVAGPPSLLLLKPRRPWPLGWGRLRPAAPTFCCGFASPSLRMSAGRSSSFFPRLAWPLVRHVLPPQGSKLEGGLGSSACISRTFPAGLTLPSTLLSVSTPGTVNSTLGRFCTHIGHFNQNCTCPRSKEPNGCTRVSVRSHCPPTHTVVPDGSGSGGPCSRHRGQVLLTDLPACPRVILRSVLGFWSWFWRVRNSLS